MPFAGRKSAPEWSEFIKGDDTGKVHCKYCKKAVSSKVERIRVHLKKCPVRQNMSPPPSLEIENGEYNRKLLAPEWAEVSKEDEGGIVHCKYCNTPISSKIGKIKQHLKKCSLRQTIATSLELESKKLAPEWTEVSKDEDSGQVHCKYCNTPVSSKIERIRQHLKKCPLRQTFSAPIELEKVELGSFCSSFEISPAALAPPKKRPKMVDFVVKKADEQSKPLDIAIAKFFFANNIPFNVANSKEYKNMIETLRPGYVGPDSCKLSNSLIDTVAEMIDSNIKIALQEQPSVTLLQDGWSNIKNDPFLATSIHTGQQAFLLNAVDCQSNQKTAEYCQELVESAIKMCHDKYGKSVFAVCTDNENKMKKMRCHLNENMPESEILTYGCSAHYINLLGNEISSKYLIKDIVEVHEYFRNHHLPHAWLNEKNGLTPQLPNSTRWNSQYDCLSTFIDNYSKYIDIVNEHHDEIPYEIKRLFENVTLFEEAVANFKKMSAVCKGLNILQTDTTNIAHAVEVWMDLLENPDLGFHKDAIKARMDQALEPFHYLANFFDPRFRGKRLTAHQEECVEHWLIENHPEWLTRFMSFRMNDPEYFPSSMFTDSVIKEFTPKVWWKIMEIRTANKENLPIGFCTFIQSLMSCPASSGSNERIFSTYGLVWSISRNQLASDKADKLAKIYHYLNVKKE